jgi:hypothetical protein
VWFNDMAAVQDAVGIQEEAMPVEPTPSVVRTTRGLACLPGPHNCMQKNAPPDIQVQPWRPSRANPQTTAAPVQERCLICFDSFPLSSMRAAACRHFFCPGCWEGYISNAIASGPASLDLRCPLPTCKAAVSGRRGWEQY